MKLEKLYKIGEVMQYSGLSRQTIHNYTLAGLIEEAKRTPSGHRLYAEGVFERLEKVKVLQSKHYTLMQIKKILEQQDDHHPTTNERGEK
ncbi:MAG TPA: MerR family transcriptional regulator [Candidatus Omnitrophota bacterium]|nr:MerR family transcriptional regulator [Candidatus Omnitrophota bacterium]